MSGVLELQSLHQIHLSEVRIYILLKKLSPQVGQVLTPHLVTRLETWDHWEMEIQNFPFSWLTALLYTEIVCFVPIPKAVGFHEEVTDKNNKKWLTSADHQAQQILYNTLNRVCQCRHSISKHILGHPSHTLTMTVSKMFFYYCGFCQILT